MGYGSGFLLKDGEFHDVRFPESLSSFVWSARDNGRVLVGQAELPDGGILHDYIRNGSGDFQLIDFPGSSVPCTGVRWINERGDIVGSYCIDEEITHGDLLRRGHFTTIDVPGSTYTDAFAINDDGVIVGRFIDRRGNEHGFKAVPRH
jgi:uncharacterized membrane protein